MKSYGYLLLHLYNLSTFNPQHSRKRDTIIYTRHHASRDSIAVTHHFRTLNLTILGLHQVPQNLHSCRSLNKCLQLTAGPQCGIYVMVLFYIYIHLQNNKQSGDYYEV
jgi:hypothetical protein